MKIETMQSLLNHLKCIPGFASNRERNVWFVGSFAALALGLWFVVTLLRFHSDPTPFELAPTSKIPSFWLVAAFGLCAGGWVVSFLGYYRLKNTTIN